MKTSSHNHGQKTTKDFGSNPSVKAAIEAAKEHLLKSLGHHGDIRKGSRVFAAELALRHH